MDQDIPAYWRHPQTFGSADGRREGSPDHFVAVVKKGTVMFEIGGVDRETAYEALRLAAHKLPVKTKVIAKESGENNGKD